MLKREPTVKLRKSRGVQESIKRSDTIGQANAAQSPDPDPTLQKVATPVGITDLVTIATETVTIVATANETRVVAAMLKALRAAVDATTGTIVIALTRIALEVTIVATVTIQAILLLTPLQMESLPSM